MYIPFRLRKPLVVSQLFVHNGATASGNFDLGLYDAAFTRLTSTGSTAQSGTNVLQVVNITDIILGPGLYYMALAMDGTTGTTFRQSSTFNEVSLRAMGIASQTSAFPLPATATPVTNAFVGIPIFGLTGRSTL